MKVIAKLSALFAALLVCATFGLAQTPKQKAVFRHGGHIVTSKDKTELGYMPIFNDGVNRNLFLYAKFGPTAVYPERPSVDIFFISVSTGAKYAQSPGLSMEVDGGRFAFGGSDTDFYAQQKGDYVVEGVGITLSNDTLVRIANAKKVVVHLGATDFQLSGDHLEALREMAYRTAN